MTKLMSVEVRGHIKVWVFSFYGDPKQDQELATDRFLDDFIIKSGPHK